MIKDVFPHRPLLAAGVGKRYAGFLSLLPVHGKSPHNVFHMRATSLTLTEYNLILAPGSNRLLISD